MTTKLHFTRDLAAAFLSGPWVIDRLVARAAKAHGRRPRWLRPLARRVMATFATSPGWSGEQALMRFLDADSGLAKVWASAADCGAPLTIGWVPPAMAPTAGNPAGWPVPALATAAALADWLGTTPTELDRLADCHGRSAHAPPGPLRHYTYRWRAKPAGRHRLIEMPKPRLKAVQRRLLHGLIDHVPAHDAAHGYRRGRSIVTYASPHAGHAIVVRFDLRDFFPSVRARHVRAVFQTAGYPPAVARLLAGLCTNRVPRDVSESDPRPEGLYGEAHLPQGAPTSPALANLCAYRLDCRLAALARVLDANYTRYADDLAFSGGQELARAVGRFFSQVCRIVCEEGFAVQARKTRFMRQGVRQRLAGVVVNARPNCARTEYDRLKAILYNCARHSPATQDREGHADFRAHLAGRVAHLAMLNAARGERLRAMFDRVRWQAG